MLNLTYQLYQASIDDCLDISQCFDSQKAITDWGGEGFLYPVQHHQFLLQLHLPDTCSYVLKHQDTIVGFGQICQRFGKHHFARLIILPAMRNQGLSYILLVSLMGRALQQNKRLDFSLFVFRDNARAIHCYQQLGFNIGPQPGPEHHGLYFMHLSVKHATQRLQQGPWQLNINSEFVNCQLKDASNAHLD
jgi:GNAT superfamily N-acetyltransferase